MSELMIILDELWAKSIIWLSGTFIVVKFIRAVTINIESSDDLSVQGKNVIKYHLKQIANKESEHWVNNFGLITDSIFGKKLFSIRSLVLSSVISIFLYFMFVSIMYQNNNNEISMLGRSKEIYFVYVIFIFPIINIIFDFISLIITRFILRLNNIKYKSKLIIDFILSVLLVILGLLIFINGTQRILAYMELKGLSTVTLSEWLYDADIEIEKFDEGRIITYKSKDFYYSVYEVDGYINRNDFQLTGDKQTIEKMKEKKINAEAAINLAMINSNGFKEALTDSGGYNTAISVIAVFATSLSTSVWLWIHGISSYTMSIVRKYTRDLRLLNIDQKPIQVVGLITCAYVISISLVSYFVFLMIMI